MHRMHRMKQPRVSKVVLSHISACPASVAERGSSAFPYAFPKTTPAASPLGSDPELPRLSSRDFRLENTHGAGFAADNICRVFHTLRLLLRCGTPRSASLHVGLDACHRLRKARVVHGNFVPFAVFPLRPLRFLPLGIPIPLQRAGYGHVRTLSTCRPGFCC